MLANSLRKQRVALGLTQNELAERFGVSRQTINNWENEHTRVPRWCSDQLRWLESAQVLPQHREGVKRGPYHVHKLKLLDNACPERD